ncbi:MAG: GNAT family N-acetyltransferase [Alphaproteobacteria bacterium]|nr:GNAT family N-acetyltransferase [Alphaproteobacteria bacterium]
MLQFKEFHIRPIEKKDNPFLAKIIRDCLEEFKANKPGTVYFDSTTDALYELFESKEKAAYWVVEKDNVILGGGGIFPTDNLPEDTLEVVKIYLVPQVRKFGLGKFLMNLCEAEALKRGFKNLYLESMPELAGAVSLYNRLGYKNICKALGNSGHCGCDVWMVKILTM